MNRKDIIDSLDKFITLDNIDYSKLSTKELKLRLDLLQTMSDAADKALE